MDLHACAADVCEIRTKEAGLSRGNTVDFMLGIAPKREPGGGATGATSVPADRPWALLLASAGLIGLAMRRARR